MITQIKQGVDTYKDYLKYVSSDFFLTELAAAHNETMQVLLGIDEDKSNYAYAQGKWTIKDTVLHLSDSERIFAYRALAFSRGEQHPLPGYDHEEYVRNADASSRTLESLVNEMRHVRLCTIDLFRSFTPHQLAAAGIANNNQVSVALLGLVIAGHERHHIHILNERYL
jgi:uncharacterized damage-inducible protein DinB